MDPLKMYFLLKMGIFHGYVSLPVGIIPPSREADVSATTELRKFRVKQSNLISFLKINVVQCWVSVNRSSFWVVKQLHLSMLSASSQDCLRFTSTKRRGKHWSKRKWRWCDVGCFFNLGIVGNMKMPVGTVKNGAPRWNNTVPHFFYIAGPGFVQWTGWLVKYSELRTNISTINNYTTAKPTWHLKMNHPEKRSSNQNSFQGLWWYCGGFHGFSF